MDPRGALRRGGLGAGRAAGMGRRFGGAWLDPGLQRGDRVENTVSGGHETMTLASVGAARAFPSRGWTGSLHGTVSASLQTKLGRPDWLLA